MIKTTVWSPDTCKCTHAYQWDSDLPDDLRVHTPVDFYLDTNGNRIDCVVCPDHAGLTTLQAHDVVRKENTSKNKLIGHMLENIPKLAKVKNNPNGNSSKMPADGVSFDVTFTGTGNARTMTTKINGVNLTKQEKDLANALVLDVPNQIV